MELELATSNIIVALITALCAVIAFIVRRILARVERIEEREHTYLTQKEIRNQVNDKVDPLRDRMTRIETKLDEIINILVQKQK